MHLERRFKIAGAAIALLALGGVGFRYSLFLSQAWDSGLSTWRATGNFLSYFTILANLLVAVAFLAPLPFLRGARARGGVTLYAVQVGLVYEVLLRRVWHPQGAEFLASLILHDAVPLAMLAYWLLLREKGALRWSQPVAWLCVPIAYLAYVFARGRFTGWWLYPFMDASRLGYPHVLLNASALLGLFLILGVAMVAWDKFGVRDSSEDLDLDEDGVLPDMA
ncbi:MAG TPA: Pr6Pr family membrane protein [Holophagaceae bacterium]|jgi:Kef-type K+ transport system membrane component KefB|nr:Pr6Pr family membrane protein [Holophagaceae bacterium]